jgi:hypothetical protein
MAKKTLNVENMFQQISGSFDKAKQSGGGIYNDILKFEMDKDYIVRLLPYREDLDETVHSYTYRGWVSKSTGKYVEVLDPPPSSDVVNPIQAYSTTLTNKLRPLKLDKEDPRMIDARKLWNKKAWLINCYVISDPTKPDNEGTVKILKVGKQLWDIIDTHVNGEREAEFGWKCFDPTAKGCNFKIKAVDNGSGKYSEYTKSYFMTPSEIDGVSDNEERIEEIFDACFDLKAVFPIKTEDEIQEILDIHFKNEEGDKAPTSFGDIDKILDEDVDVDTDDDADDDVEEVEEVQKPSKKKETKKETKKVEDDDDLDDLIANL